MLLISALLLLLSILPHLPCSSASRSAIRPYQGLAPPSAADTGDPAPGLRRWPGCGGSQRTAGWRCRQAGSVPSHTPQYRASRDQPGCAAEVLPLHLLPIDVFLSLRHSPGVFRVVPDAHLLIADATRPLPIRIRLRSVLRESSRRYD
jgi:hypothetical protein